MGRGASRRRMLPAKRVRWLRLVLLLLDVLRHPLLERLQLVVELVGGHLLVRLRLADEPWRGLHGRAPGGLVRIRVVALAARRLGRRLDLVEVDVCVLPALALVVLDSSPLTLQPLGLVPDRLAKRRVLVAVR